MSVIAQRLQVSNRSVELFISVTSKKEFENILGTQLQRDRNAVGN